jgi:hypothetical protein
MEGYSKEKELNNSVYFHHEQSRWRKLKEEKVKCNLTRQLSRACYGIGMCLRGRHGKYIKSRTTWFQGLPQPHETEERGLKEAIKWIGSLGLSNELDCKQVVDDIVRRLNTNSMFDVILEICKTSLRIYTNFKISFIRRQIYNVAHLLARASLYYASSQIHDHMSSCIGTVIINEMS